MATLIFNHSNNASVISVELDWLIRHADEVQKIVTTEDPRYSHAVFFFAHLSTGGTFTTRFADKSVCLDWLRRSGALKGVPVEFCGETFQAGHRE